MYLNVKENAKKRKKTFILTIPRYWEASTKLSKRTGMDAVYHRDENTRHSGLHIKPAI